MKTRLLVIIGIIILSVIGMVFGIAAEISYGLISMFFHSVIIEDKSELCMISDREWDEKHNTCDSIVEEQCFVMDGNFVECKPREWRFPEDNLDCLLSTMCIPTCNFD